MAWADLPDWLLRLVHNDGEGPIPLTGNLFQMLGGKFLNGGDDYTGTLRDGLFELFRRTVDPANHSLRLLKLCDGALKLAVEHNAVSDDDCCVEHRLIIRVMQINRMVSEPADGVRFA